MKIAQVGMEDQQIVEILSELGVLSAICDFNLENKDGKFSVNYYNSLDHLLESEDFQAACVNSDKSTFTNVKKLLEAKKHVFVDIPIFDLSQLDELEKISNKNKVHLSFGIKQKFNPVIQTLKKMIEEQTHGELLILELYKEILVLDNDEMFFEEILSEISLANEIFGEMPIVVFARIEEKNNQKESYGTIMIGYRNNKTALILLNGVSPKKESTIRAICTNDVINSNLVNLEINVNKVSKTIPKSNPMLPQIQKFIDSCYEISKHDFRPLELKNLIEITEAALLSSKQGVPIYLDLK